MYGPKVAAKPQTKADPTSARNPAHQRSTLLAHRSGYYSAEQAPFLQRTIGNQAMLRHATPRLTSLPAKPPSEYSTPQAARVIGEASSAAWDFGKVPVFSSVRINQSCLQSPTAAPPRSLAMGAVDDPLEHEADAIADKAIRMPAGEVDGERTNSTVSEKPGPVDVHRKALASNSVSSSQSPAHVQNAIGSGGQKLDPSTRKFFEPRLGYNLNSVRIYTGSRAAESARAIDAKAYTLGNNIVFGAGQYRPETDVGKHLLAHELAHAVQSGSSSKIKRDTIYRQPDGGSAQLAAIEYEIQMLSAMPVKFPTAIMRRAELYEQRNRLSARRAGFSTPAQTKPAKSPARAAGEQYWATYGKENLQAFSEYMDRAEEVTEANRVYMTTGRIPQTKSPFLSIEIKEGRSMTRAERYDAMVRKLGPGKTIAQIDDITYDNRDPEYLTQREFQEEYWARYHAERDNCYDEYFWPKYERQCIRRVQEEYGGESFITWREGRERELAYRVQVAKAQIGNVVSSGAIGTFGRAAGYIAARVSGHDEQEALEWSEHGATIGGWGDAYLGVRAGTTARAGTQNYKGGGGHVVSRDTPTTLPLRNVAAPPQREPSPSPGNKLPSSSTVVADPWAGSVQRPLELSKKFQAEPSVLSPPPKPSRTAQKSRQDILDDYVNSGKVTKVKAGESGIKNQKPKKPEKEITARPKDIPFESQRAEQMGDAKDSPEVKAVQVSQTPKGKQQSAQAETGNFGHNDLPRYLAYFKARGDTANASRLQRVLNWPSGVKPNKRSFTMSDGRPGIPDGLGAGIVYELKPDTKTAWAQRGEYQASEYAAQLNKEKYLGRTDWRPKVITYRAKSLERLLRKWGVLANK